MKGKQLFEECLVSESFFFFIVEPYVPTALVPSWAPARRSAGRVKVRSPIVLLGDGWRNDCYKNLELLWSVDIRRSVFLSVSRFRKVPQKVTKTGMWEGERSRQISL